MTSLDKPCVKSLELRCHQSEMPQARKEKDFHLYNEWNYRLHSCLEPQMGGNVFVL